MRKQVVLVLFLFLLVLPAFLMQRHNVMGRKTEAEKFDLSGIVPYSSKAAATAISEPLSSFRSRPSVNAQSQPQLKKTPDLIRSFPQTETAAKWKQPPLADVLASPMPPVSLTFDGLSNFDNIALYNLLIIPPDMIGDVGPNHYVQAVNAALRIYDKSGKALAPPFKLSDIFAPLGTVCSQRIDGEPNVLYDPLADRWLISQYCNAFPPFRQMVAVSESGDPTGRYYLFEFVMPNVKLNDLAKFGVWPDAFYMSTEEYLGSDYAGVGAFAFDRAKMLRGDPDAGYIYFSMPTQYAARLGNLLPADIDGLTAPAGGAAGVFVSYTADEYGDAADTVRLFEFRPDFVHPANSTFNEMAESPLTVAPFDPTSPAGRTDIVQPPPGERLDSGSDRLMYRAAYRNLGNVESMVFNLTVRTSNPASAYAAGVKLFELSRPTGGAFSVVEQATIGDDQSYRWNASAAQDHQGNLAVQYNYANPQKVPSLLYAGRLATEPAGSVRQEETFVAGTGVQKAFGWRWGDYSGMTVDPVDDCTFWVTGEYYTRESEEFSDFTWLTRIGSFKFPECTSAPRAFVTGTVTNAATDQPISGVELTAAAYTRTTDLSGEFGPAMIVPGSYTLRASARGFRDAAVSFTITNGETRHLDISMQPVAVIESTAAELTNESCRINHAAEPGETVTVNVSLRNRGALAAQDLTAALEASGGVTSPGPAQNYGPLSADGSVVARPFTFTVSPDLPCGSAIPLTLRLTDGGQDLGSVIVQMPLGATRYALAENFDRTIGGLPIGWTSWAATAQRRWTISTTRTQSPPYSAFSPDVNQVGVNELVSPAFRITNSDSLLTFRNWYDLETTFLRNRLFDGSVLEIKIGDEAWQDILAAGGTFESGGYDGPLDSCCQNPLAGRLAWSGRSGPNEQAEFITTRVKLPVSAAGHTVQLRWRIGTDVGTFREGQYIDDLTVTDGYSCNCSSLGSGVSSGSSEVRTPSTAGTATQQRQRYR
jgi:hypothetical protein